MSVLRVLVLLPLLYLLAGSAHGQLLEQRIHIKAEPGKRVTEYNYLLKVRDKSMDELADIAIHHRGEEEMEILEASLLDAFGKHVRDISKKEIIARHNTDEGIFFSDQWVSQFKVVGRGYPFHIRYRYRIITKKFTHLIHWYPPSNAGATLQITTPRTYQLLIEQSTGSPPTVTMDGKTITRTWTCESIDPLPQQSYSPPQWEQWPHVVVAPVVFEYVQEGSNSSWSEYGKWLAALGEGTDILPQEEKYVVNGLLNGVTDSREKIRKLYHHLQDNTRYVAIEVDEGGLKPLPASFVSAKKFGDCKALTVYMKALLKEAGIASYYAPVFGGKDPVRGAKMVPAQIFNHVILCVPLAGDTVWLESTAGYIPYGYLGTHTQGREVLLVCDGANSRLTRTPALTASDVRCHDEYFFSLQSNGNGTVQVNRSVRGQSFEYLRYYLHKKLIKEMNDYIRRELPMKVSEITEQHVGAHRDSSAFTIDLIASIENQIRNVAGTLVIAPPKLEVPVVETPAQRVTPVRFTYPVAKSSHISYRLALENDQVVTFPENVKHTAPFGEYSIVYSQEASVITVKKSILLYAGDYPLDKYKGLYEFLQRIHQSEKQPILINRTSR